MQRSKRKSLGQHFLKDRKVLRRILREIGPRPDELIIEIGAGRGVLTFPLSQKAGQVAAIEKDAALIPCLRKKNIANLTILEKDVLSIHFREIIEAHQNFQRKVKLVGNLPYSISGPLLFNILKEKELFQKCVFLLQREVGERVCSRPGSKKYAPLSILIQIHFEARLHTVIPPEAFSPPPQVESALVSLDRREVPLFFIRDESRFSMFLKDAFKHRRKILLNNLIRSGLPSSRLEEAYQKIGLERNVRPEQLSISRFVQLFDFLHGRRQLYSPYNRAVKKNC
ncbi:MAG: 16S rRNA (adenine(1518)-N(6)/adenine(1519)-N(6))-dimethyltransferase RsmA [Candidatus Aminicenantales bacterium]